MPLSGIGLCDAESIDAEVGAGLRGEERHARRRQHTDPHDRRPRAGQAGDDRGLEHLAAGPRIPPDDREWRVRTVGLGQHVRRGDRDPQSASSGAEVGVGETPDAVGAEESTHETPYLARNATAGSAQQRAARPFDR